MRIRLFAAYLLTSCFASIACLGAEPWTWQEAQVPEMDFHLDEARVVRVTTLEASGDGSLRAALQEKGPRIVVFEVGGVIDLGKKSLEVVEPQVIIAGQTAPGPGITLIRGGLRIASNQTVVQHLSVRPGDAGQAKGSGWEPDGISTTGGPVDVWIDHCSVTWSIDEGISPSTYKSPTGEPTRRVYLRDCLIAEGLAHSTHGKGEHSKGTLVMDGTKQVAIVRCLFASNTERNPVFKLDTSGVVVNCVIANPGQRAIHASDPALKGPTLPKAQISVVGNVVLFGEKSKRSARAIFEGTADGYFKDNEGYDWFGKPLELLRKPFDTLAEPAVWPEGLEAMSTTAALWHVARFVGARPAVRDSIDQRIVSSALVGSAQPIDSQDEVGGYPQHETVTRALEVPETRRAEWLEKLAREVVFGGPAESVKESR